MEWCRRPRIPSAYMTFVTCPARILSAQRAAYICMPARARRQGGARDYRFGSRARAGGRVVDGGVAAEGCRRGLGITGSSGSRARAGGRVVDRLQFAWRVHPFGAHDVCMFRVHPFVAERRIHLRARARSVPAQSVAHLCIASTCPLGTSKCQKEDHPVVVVEPAAPSRCQNGMHNSRR